MEMLYLFPADYFDIKQVDGDYENEYSTVLKFPEYRTILYHYDEFISDGKLRLYSDHHYTGNCIYRGWMLKPSQYEMLYNCLLDKNIRLINSTEEYAMCHLFPHSYNFIKDYTPKSISFTENAEIDWQEVNTIFKSFMIKDYVKSVKGMDFPRFFETPVDSEKMNGYIRRFIDLRDSLFTGGIVLKEYVPIKRYNGLTNEYRAFFLKGKLLSIAKNSNQARTCKTVPVDFVNLFDSLKSNFYTVDFAELEDGSWIVIETGDGQVSGLSPGQYIFKYYDEMRRILGDF